MTAQNPDFDALIDRIEKFEKERLWEDAVYAAKVYLEDTETISLHEKTVLNIKRLKGLTARGLFDEALILANAIQENSKLSVEEENIVFYEVSKIYENTAQEYKSHQALDGLAANYDNAIIDANYANYLKQKASVYKMSSPK